MTWASFAIEKLQAGESVTIRPRGNSMLPLIKSGQEVTLIPLDEVDKLEVGNIVLVKVKGNVYLHLIKSIDGDRYLIGNNRGRTNGWVRISSIYGMYEKSI